MTEKKGFNHTVLVIVLSGVVSVAIFAGAQFWFQVRWQAALSYALAFACISIGPVGYLGALKNSGTRESELVHPVSLASLDKHAKAYRKQLEPETAEVAWVCLSAAAFIGAFILFVLDIQTPAEASPSWLLGLTLSAMLAAFSDTPTDESDESERKATRTAIANELRGYRQSLGERASREPLFALIENDEWILDDVIAFIDRESGKPNPAPTSASTVS